jgi:hypothetical protein
MRVNTFHLKIFDGIVLAILLILLIHCGKKQEKAQDDPIKKIKFDLSQLNENGLYGPRDGLRALHYEFCIPANEKLMEAVKTLDPSLEIVLSSSGRVGCSKSEFLCLGNTHQENYREILLKLAKLPYVESIEQSFFE